MRTLRMLTGSILIAMTPLALAQTPATVDSQTQALDTTAANHGQTQVATQIASSFTALAGSRDNALALVRALRNGTAVTLTTTTPPTTGTAGGSATTTTTTFTPPTGRMGWGNVFISLALARDSLARIGITQPTPQQLQAALVGGSVTGADGSSVALRGVLTMRADGMGWGQIAQTMGTKLGPVVSAIKSTQVKVARLPAASTTSATTATSTTKSATSGSGPKALTTAASASPSTHGQGIVTAGGGSGAGVTSAPGHGHGNSTGVVSATGAAASSTVTNAGASGGDNGKGHGRGHGGG